MTELIRSATRRLDTPCRIGGDEFAIILPTIQPRTIEQPGFPNA